MFCFFGFIIFRYLKSTLCFMTYNPADIISKFLNWYLKFLLLRIGGNSPSAVEFVDPKVPNICKEINKQLMKVIRKEIYELIVLSKGPTIIWEDSYSFIFQSSKPTRDHYLAVFLGQEAAWSGAIVGWSQVFSLCKEEWLKNWFTSQGHHLCIFFIYSPEVYLTIKSLKYISHSSELIVP